MSCISTFSRSSFLSASSINASWGNASTPVGKLQYYHGGTGVFPWWYWDFSVDFFPTCLSSLAVFAGREAFHAEEELAQRGSVGEMEAVGDLLDAEARCSQQEGCFHHEHLVDVVDDGATRHLADDAREIDAGDVEP